MSPLKKPRMTQVVAPPPPPVPTMDDAAMREEFSRKVRRRVGHRRNDTGAASGANVASRVLLG